MSLFRRRSLPGPTAEQLIPRRPDAVRGTARVTNETALRHSAVWACLRLRANMISTMPVDLYRKVDGIQVEVTKPPVLVTPGGDKVDMQEWLYSSQFDLDRAGNCFGLITAKDGLGFPARIDLVPLGEVTVKGSGGEITTYRIGSTEYEPAEIWHERQYTVAGFPLGLSPVAYAAWSIAEYLSIQDFALDWFGTGGMPAAMLKNTAKAISPQQAAEVKSRFKAATANRDLFVAGADWEYRMIQAEQAGSAWVDAKQFGIADVARFFDCPGDLIDAAVGGTSLTYANISQRNLQFLIMNLGPAVVRREAALSRLSSRPRFVKLNTDALLRMDPATRSQTIRTQIEARILAPSEARALEDRPPFTESQYAEFDRLFGSRNPPPTQAPAPTVPPGGTP
ncbi:phage portal protein [Kitasatospora purpeofusca]|uniref:phage portal protein n=1 Tax=Kitasatospora purpeofusca TaxID=67352 RepID=UPI002253A2AC|nr:phage portal protein [Kitasatospora purpeofusca]MCX4752900.1 phage portal protein [Kitasatospora purpeofusca]WSR32444.1 phage portal protein [Kitasatospora purpeofusca]